jgi:hypothetical protein
MVGQDKLSSSGTSVCYNPSASGRTSERRRTQNREMERDSLLSHGITEFFGESMLDRGDKFYGDL